MRYVFVILFSVQCLMGSAQNIDSLANRSLAASVLLDSVVVTAAIDSLGVQEFIHVVLEDESLYTAFKNLRMVSCSFETEMTFKDKKDNNSAGMSGSYRQEYEEKCRFLSDKAEEYEGKYFKGKKAKERFYTARLYQRVFITEGRVCEGASNDQSNERGDPKMESRIDELKQLIFNPGKKARVPLIAGKTELFDPEFMKYYDFTISEETDAGNQLYKFEALAKPEYRDGRTVFKKLTTWFNKDDFQVMARSYELVASTAAYSFDVTMHVDLLRVEGKYYPSRVLYDGTWNIPFKRRETGRFEIIFSDFVAPNP